MTAELVSLDRYRIRRKVFKLFGASFHVYDPAGRVVGYSKQAAFRLREDIRVYADEAMSTPLLTIRARQIVDFSAAYDFVDPTEDRKGGAARRKGWSSILRDAWELLDAQDRGKREFAVVQILSGPLAKRGVVPLQVQQIIDDLKCQSKLLPIGIQACQLLVIRPADDSAQAEADADQGSRFTTMDAL